MKDSPRVRSATIGMGALQCLNTVHPSLEPLDRVLHDGLVEDGGARCLFWLSVGRRARGLGVGLFGAFGIDLHLELESLAYYCRDRLFYETAVIRLREERGMAARRQVDGNVTSLHAAKPTREAAAKIWRTLASAQGTLETP